MLDYGSLKDEECMVRPKNLSRADVRKLEDGLNTNDLEVMIAYVDQIVGNAIRRVKRNLNRHEDTLDHRARRDAQGKWERPQKGRME